MAGCLNVSASGYYKWPNRKNQSLLTKRDRENVELAEEIRTLFFQRRGIFGVKDYESVIKIVGQVNHKRVERLTREQGLRSRTKKQYISTTDSNIKSL